MRFLCGLFLLFTLTTNLLGDIQDPPGNDYGPTRKLGRGLSNLVFGGTEIPVAIAQINAREGNAAAAAYGVIRGTGRAFARMGAGLYEVLLWPFPVNRGAFLPVLPIDIPWSQRGYCEFPPEPGNETKYRYTRSN